MTSVRIDKVSKRFGDTIALDAIDLKIEAGELFFLLGPSGCGKSTLLRVIAGLLEPTAGRVFFNDRDVTALGTEKRNAVMCFQSYALWPHMTVAQNIGYGLKLRGTSRAAIAGLVAAMLAMLRLGGLTERRVTELSGGQRQRVALGRALVINPQILLLDEPLSNLDARIREDVRHEIKMLQRELGITTVHVTHDREEAMVMADRIVILDKGRIAQMGAPEEIYNNPNSPFVADFMGAGNVVRLRARRLAEGLAIEEGPNNDALTLAATKLHDRLPQSGAIVAHFRGEAARLHALDAASAGDLVLRGRIAQASYPGGVWRYSVRVGDDHFLVDDKRRLPVGETVGIGLPVDALHLYVANP